MKKEAIQIADKTCIIYIALQRHTLKERTPHNRKSEKSEQTEYLLIQPIDEHDLEVLDNQVAVIQSLTNRSFTLLAFEIKDWQGEITPWTPPAVFGRIPFGNGAVATLSFIKEMLIPQLEEMQLFDKDKMKYVLGGYSLAGFFALWSAYQTEFFDGIAAVSPSVWYPQWMEYAEENEPLATSVYLSLGDKEEKTKNPTMAQVGNCIRKQQELLTAQGINTILEWNPGNHFQHSDERTAKGFAWIINHI